MKHEQKEGDSTVKYFNGFGEDINIYRQEDCTFSNATQKWFLNDHEEVIPDPIRVFESDRLLRAFYATKQLEPIDWGVSVIPSKICIGVEDLPHGYDKYIVTKAFKAASREIGFPINRLVTPCNKVYNKYFKCVGYLSLLAY